MKIRIFYEDTDVGGIVYHANYIKFCERARSEASFRLGADIFSEKGCFVVTGIECKFVRPARLGDVVEVRTKLAWARAASAAFTQEIWRVGRLGEACVEVGEAGSELLFSGVFKEAFLSYGRPSKFDEEAEALMGKFDEWVY